MDPTACFDAVAMRSAAVAISKVVTAGQPGCYQRQPGIQPAYQKQGKKKPLGYERRKGNFVSEFGNTSIDRTVCGGVFALSGAII
ncbi:hypothetical protein ACI2KS_24155 [Pseudomonas sp. NPDC087358]|uniref:hypothetical protein n=1 Tax=Pseudomonas sp. NPDC087358 TaxID=3364439 RepID=UPI0038501B14